MRKATNGKGPPSHSLTHSLTHCADWTFVPLLPLTWSCAIVGVGAATRAKWCSNSQQRLRRRSRHVEVGETSVLYLPPLSLSRSPLPDKHHFRHERKSRATSNARQQPRRDGQRRCELGRKSKSLGKGNEGRRQCPDVTWTRRPSRRQVGPPTMDGAWKAHEQRRVNQFAWFKPHIRIRNAASPPVWSTNQNQPTNHLRK